MLGHDTALALDEELAKVTDRHRAEAEACAAALAAANAAKVTRRAVSFTLFPLALSRWNQWIQYTYLF